jgi:hypothetical protein
MNDIIFRVVQFPTAKTKGFVKLDDNGDYNVYVNVSLNREQQKDAGQHEYRHIRKNHLYRDISVADAEKEVK